MPKGLCAAPHTSLRFEPDGRVSVCCINGQYPLSVKNETIREIWDGSRLRRLREAIDEGDYSLGCMPCEAAHKAGNRTDTEAASFDHLVSADMEMWPQRLEFALSNVCNLQCVMCNGELSSAIRANREHRPPLRSSYDDRFFDELDEFLPHAKEVAFLGGEPFLSRDAARVWDRMIDLDCQARVIVTTNGTILNDRVESYVERLKMNLAVSIDGTTAHTFESIRVGADFYSVNRNLARFKTLTGASGASLVINHCLMTLNWKEFPELLLRAEQSEIPVSLILVTYPKRFSLTELPLTELREVAEFFASHEPDLGSKLITNLAVWRDATRRVADMIASLEAVEATPVSVRLAGGRATRLSERLALAIEELGRTTGVEPVIINVEDDIIVSVDDQSWASEFHFTDHLQASLLRLLPQLCKRMGVEPSVETEQIAPGLSSTVLTGTDDGNVRFRLASVMGEWT